MNIIFLILLFCMILSLKTKLIYLQILLFEIYAFYISEIDVYSLLQIYYGTKERIKQTISQLPGPGSFSSVLEKQHSTGMVCLCIFWTSLQKSQSSIKCAPRNGDTQIHFLPLRVMLFLLRGKNLWAEEQIQCKWYIFSGPRYCHCFSALILKQCPQYS